MNLFIYVEGQEEEQFVNRILRNHFLHFGIVVQKPILAATSFRIDEDGPRVTVGGVTNYSSIREDILDYYRTGKIRPTDALTTFIDLYALPKDFPGYSTASEQNLVGEAKALHIEQAWKAAVGHANFFPYIQVHEFEALVLTNPLVLNDLYPEHAAGIEQLRAECAVFHTPEEINETKETSPSHRIKRYVPNYVKENGFRFLENIGLTELRGRCPHFSAWFQRCETFFR